MKLKKLMKHTKSIKLVYDFDSKKATDKFYKMLTKGFKKSLNDCEDKHECEVLNNIELIKCNKTVSVVCKDAAAVELLDDYCVIDNDMIIL